MSPRRANPEPKRRVARNGDISWYVRYRVPGPDGAPMQTTQVFDTRRDAGDFCADIRDFGTIDAVRRLEQRRTLTAPAPTGPVFAGVFDEFLAWKTSRVRSTRTVEDYKAQGRVLRAAFGGRPIDSITDADVQRWVDALVEGRVNARTVKDDDGRDVTRPVARKTILNYHGLLHSVFDYAAHPARGYVTVNPCSHTDLPKGIKTPPKGLTDGELDALLAAMRNVDNPDAYDLALALSATGARFSEITALSDYDVALLPDGTAEFAIGHVMRRETGGRRRVQDTKSAAGFRRVRVDVDAAVMVRRRLESVQPGGLVFTNRHGRPWDYTNFREYGWVPAVKAANLTRRPTPHWLRHTHVRQLVELGASLPEIQARIGHESIGTTINVYGRSILGVGGGVLEGLAARRATRPAAPVVKAGPTVAGEVVSG